MPSIEDGQRTPHDARVPHGGGGKGRRIKACLLGEDAEEEHRVGERTSHGIHGVIVEEGRIPHEGRTRS